MLAILKSLAVSALTSVTGMSKYLYTILAAVVLALIMTSVYYKKHYEAEIADVATVKAQLDQALQNINLCNSKVDALKAESDARIKAGEEAVAKAHEASLKDQNSAQKILETPVAPTPKEPLSASDATQLASIKKLFKDYVTNNAAK